MTSLVLSPLPLGQSDLVERLEAAPWFDPEAYLARHTDVAAAELSAAEHYVRHGWREGRELVCPGLAEVQSDPKALQELEELVWPAWVLEQLEPEAQPEAEEPASPAITLTHLLRLGCLVGLDPNPLFSCEEYLRSNPDVEQAGVPPLLHFLLSGGREGRHCHWLLDAEFLQSQGVVAPLLQQFLRRYLAGEALQPNPTYPLAPPAPEGAEARRQQLIAYAAAHPAATHALLQRALEPVRLLDLEQMEAEASAAEVSAAEASSLQQSNVSARPPAQLIAFYLPQFHRIPENDAWWGDGFTDWTNALKAQPFYPGQLQPHRPTSDLGAYDLADPAVMARQVELAHRYGITAFCFHHYWFDGRPLLERPLQQWLGHPELDLGFCLCWANETWSRRWDGSPHEVLIAQSYPADYVERFAASLLPALRDRRYMRWNGAPVLLVYRAGDLPDAADFARRLRRTLAEAGIARMQLLTVWSFDREDPRRIGFDGAVQFAPLQVPTPNLASELPLRLEPGEEPCIYGYPEALLHGLRQLGEPHPFPLYGGACPSWDNTARRGGNSVSWIGATPARFERWLRLARLRLQQRAQTGEVAAAALFVNAWNEWGEGCHLEPDQHWGQGWLEAVQRALTPRTGGLVLLGHDACNAGAQRTLLCWLAELRRALPQLELQVVVLGEGELLASYDALAPTRVVQPDALAGELAAFAARQGTWAVLANSVVSLPPLQRALAALTPEQAPTWRGLFVHELPSMIRALGLQNALEQACAAFDLLVSPSRLVNAELLATDSAAGPGSGASRLVVPPRDERRWLQRPERFCPPPPSLPEDAFVVLGCGRDRGTLERFLAVLLPLRQQWPAAEGLWVGPVAPLLPLPGLHCLPRLDIEAALQRAAAFVLSTGGRSNPGESYGLVAADAVRQAVPVIDFGQPLGLREWLPGYPEGCRLREPAEAVALLLELAADGARARALRQKLAEQARVFRSRDDQAWRAGVDAVVELLEAAFKGARCTQ
ncbi:glycoside hydrolase family 99-like domain-containing protein [Synechococcus sp. CBW1002]|uniref:glycosyltransferase WbsX family protein n=1 Tax=Synechococcus sp. CBW1002 TaxID=1353134 RepID=UPI0018CE987D|nr:glycoside hydrolase family 99-like domain-containing protein [Synechococcus sp. CBW1002]QPN59093.1 glycoside hydrolase family 99-like domain-containing protein [Synechococcus sp. CBW1002]